jgi:plastocyanin
MNRSTRAIRKSLALKALAMFALLSLALLASTMPIAEVAALTHEVRIQGFAFVPQNVTIAPGDTILWNNTDPVLNTLWFVHVGNSSTYLLSDPIAPGSTWTHTFNDEVELQYYSFDKLWMTGFITVQLVHDVAVTDVTTSKTGCTPAPTVCQGYTAQVYVTVENQGAYAETFNVTAYANVTVIGELETSLDPADNTTLTFVFDSTGFPLGNYIISAEADTVAGETDIGDNTLADGSLLVTIPGDVNGDDVVDIFDAVAIALAFGATPVDPNWNINADITNDDLIDIFDIVIVAIHFGETAP